MSQGGNQRRRSLCNCNCTCRSDGCKDTRNSSGGQQGVACGGFEGLRNSAGLCAGRANTTLWHTIVAIVPPFNRNVLTTSLGFGRTIGTASGLIIHGTLGLCFSIKKGSNHNLPPRTLVGCLSLNSVYPLGCKNRQQSDEEQDE